MQTSVADEVNKGTHLYLSNYCYSLGKSPSAPVNPPGSAVCRCVTVSFPFLPTRDQYGGMEPDLWLAAVLSANED